MQSDGESLNEQPGEGVAERFGLERLPFERGASSLSDAIGMTGKVCLVTGGGGTGLGAAVGNRLAELGANVAVLDIDEDAARAKADELQERWQVTCSAVTADVGDWEQMNAAVDVVTERHGRIDVLVHNAGGSGAVDGIGNRVQLGTAFVDMSPEQIDLLARLNFLGTLYVARAVLPVMIANGSGRVVFVASEGGRVGLRGSAVYADSKAGMMSLTRTLAQEVGPEGVTTVCISPGLMLGQRHFAALNEGGPFADLLDQAMERVSIGRPATYDEVAMSIAFHASPAGEYAHGTTISVGGGISG